MAVGQQFSQALKQLPDRNKLVILISKRVKQLSNGAQPLVDVERNNSDYIDIALKEVIENKIWYQEPKEEVTV